MLHCLLLLAEAKTNRDKPTLCKTKYPQLAVGEGKKKQSSEKQPKLI